jgi:hypothetical protein
MGGGQGEGICVGRGSSNGRVGSPGFCLPELAELQNSWCSAGLGLMWERKCPLL